jgi:dethiobiotin synthetase
MRGVFITGTSTGVGKTYIAALLAKALTEENINVIPRKPVESGCEIIDGELIPSDAQTLKLASSYNGLLSAVCPYRFTPPVSPARAARLVNQTITTARLTDACLNESENGFMLIEGAGGFYSPLSEDGLNADLAMALQLPVLLVADNSLGVLNQVLLNAEAINRRGLDLVAVILNNIGHSNNECMDNAADLRELLTCKVLVYDQRQDKNLPEELIRTVIGQPAV